MCVGGYLEDSCVLEGVMLNKDVVHPGMRRRIENPRIILLDCPLEYKKAESQTNLELTKESDFEAVLRQEETFIENVCNAIIKLKPDLVCTEKGVAGRHSFIFILLAVCCFRISCVFCFSSPVRCLFVYVCMCVDLAQHYLQKAGISVLRRLRKTDNNRIARAVGATICSQAEELKESDVGTRCGLFEGKYA